MLLSNQITITPVAEKKYETRKTYSHEEVLKASIDYFDGDTLAAEAFVGKYALRDMEGCLHELTPVDMHNRLADEFFRIESKYKNPMSREEIFDLLRTWTFVPQGSPMAAIGNKFQLQSLSNCFVIESPHDSYGGILKTDQEQAQIMKRRGGVGFDISSIRPKGMMAANAARTTDGIGVFMERFSNTCREVAQGGRRGALMLCVSGHHPEIRTFINIKRDLTKVTGANISIRLSDEFMNAVRDGTHVQLRFPVEKNAKHTVSEYVNARELWSEIIEAAHASAEPGLLFWDTITRMSPADAYASQGFETIATNPCSELPLSKADSCRLSLLNLTKFVNKPFNKHATFDFERFERIVVKSQRLMDDLVDLELEVVDKILEKIELDPEPDDVKRIEVNLWNDIKVAVVNGRRTGLGVTALGDTLALLGIRYGTDEAVEATDKIYRSLAISSYRSSVQMAKERGVFPVFSHDLERDQEFISRIMAEDEVLLREYIKHGRRNIANLTTAPAGTVSVLTQTTSGCEPAFLLKYKRRRKINANDTSEADFVDAMGDKWKTYDVFHHGFLQWLKVHGYKRPETEIEFEELLEKSPYYLATSNDTNWVKKIEMQAAAQKWIDHAISSTTNIPADSSVELVKQIYMKGWELGCKGVTVYRDGCRNGVLIKSDGEVKQPEKNEEPKEINTNDAPRRPKVLPCDIHRATVKGEQYMVLVGLLYDRPYEIFCGLSEQIDIPKKKKSGQLVKNGKKDGVSTYDLKIPIGDDDEVTLKNIVKMFDNPEYGALTRIISLSMRHGVSIQYLVEQLKKDRYSDLQSFSSVVARVLKNYIVDETPVTAIKMCEQCGDTQALFYQEGCVSCRSCGWSKC